MKTHRIHIAIYTAYAVSYLSDTSILLLQQMLFFFAWRIGTFLHCRSLASFTDGRLIAPTHHYNYVCFYVRFILPVFVFLLNKFINVLRSELSVREIHASTPTNVIELFFSDHVNNYTPKDSIKINSVHECIDIHIYQSEILDGYVPSLA